MEETDTGQAEAESHRCKACRKPIKPNAKLCPYCHSRQTDTPWHKISVLLQWSAGAVTMVSLIVALNTLTNFYAGWLEKKNTAGGGMHYSFIHYIRMMMWILYVQIITSQ